MSGISSFRDLLSNISNCDLQILHSLDYENQLSSRDLSFVSTTVFMPKYDDVLRNFGSFKTDGLPSLDTVKVRVSPCRISFIFLGAGAKNSKHSFKRQVERWIQFASKHYFYYGPHHGYDFFLNTNAYITVVISKPELLKGMFHLPVFNQVSFIVDSPEQNFKICLLIYSKIVENMVKHITCASEIQLSGETYITLVDKHINRLSKLCIHGVEWGEVKDTQTTPTTGTTSRINATVRTSFTQLVLKVFSNANISVLPDSKCLSESVKHVKLTFDAGDRPTNMEETTIDVTLIQRGFEGYKFLTCYAEPYITLNFYITPFQPDLWLVLGTTIGIIVAITTLCQHFFSLLEQQRFSAWMYVLASLFEETGFMPTRISKHNFFRISFGIWSIMSVVLTNGYNGIMISELNSPMRQFQTESFDQLDCGNKILKTIQNYLITEEINLPGAKKQMEETLESVYTSFYFELVHLTSSLPYSSFEAETVYLNMTKVDHACYRLLSTFEQSVSRVVLPEFLAVLRNLAKDHIDYGGTHFSMFKDLILFSRKHSYYPRGFSYLSENLTYPTLQSKIEG
ncbi:hypothetical protein Fcan01_22817 [Folsomia candida]|uniref:Uncharacterized protein n=1 Tax=Folsomia candida TaxID=158441 RepID=A0A226DAC2_FOLCA|nr:hypothetical protein Fcan01_22817 [Folsomia candida]